MSATILPLSAHASHTRLYQLEGSSQMLDGNPETTLITAEGALSLPFVVRDWLTDSEAVFTASTDHQNAVVVARADSNEVLRIDEQGRTTVLFKADDKPITALLSTPVGLMIATGGPGAIHRVDAEGQDHTFYVSEAEDILAMVRGPDDSILCVTGNPATVLKIDTDGKGEILFSSDQTHLRSIAYDPWLGIFVGGGEHGILYRSANGGRFHALYDSGHTEIPSLLIRGAYVYLAATTGARELSFENAGDESFATVRSQLGRVAMDGSYESLGGSDDEAVFAIAFAASGEVLAATGGTGGDEPHGRLYSIDPADRRITMVYQSPSRRIMQLVTLSGGRLIAVSAAEGRVTEISAEMATQGEFFSKPFDTGGSSRFGRLSVLGDWPKGTRVTAAVRTGRVSDPNDGWSVWSPAIRVSKRRHPNVPKGRYVQVRLTLTRTGERSPTVRRVRLSYLRQNRRPVVREVVALPKGIAMRFKPKNSSFSKTINLKGDGLETFLDDKDESKKPASRGSARRFEQPGALTIKWVASDPDGDELRYDLSRRANRRWQVVEKDLKHPFYTFRSSQLPDGYYRFRVEATDGSTRPDGVELNGIGKSRSVLIDNTPPAVSRLNTSVKGQTVTTRFLVTDNLGPLTDAAYALDGASFRPLIPDDGILDGTNEQFTLRLSALEPGPHSLSIRVRDAGDNVGLGQSPFAIE